MLLPRAKTLPPSPSRLLHQSLQTKTLRPTSILHALLRRTGLSACLSLRPTLPPDTHDPSPWNAAVAAFARHGFTSLALQTLSLMHRLAFPLDTYALCSGLTAAAASSNPKKPGIQIHAYASRAGWLSSIFVDGALIDLYAKSNDPESALQLFDEIPLKNTVCLNSLLSGYVESRLWVEGISLLRRMRALRLEPDGFTLSAVLRICAGASDIELGKQVHAHLIRKIQGMEKDGFLLSSLVEMYGKSGLVHKARIVFELAGQMAGKGGRDVVLWTSMLNAYGRNGRFEDVIEAYEEMLAEGIQPDELVFVAVLSACSHSGCVVSGLKCFDSMGRDYGMVPRPEHYGCVVDMLCRAGELEMAWKFANEMVFEEQGGGAGFGVSVWGSLLTACKDCGNVEIGKAAAQRALELDPGNVGIYFELSNLYARVGMWDEIGELRELIKERGLKKDVGCSWLEHTDWGRHDSNFCLRDLWH